MIIINAIVNWPADRTDIKRYRNLRTAPVPQTPLKQAGMEKGIGIGAVWDSRSLDPKELMYWSWVSKYQCLALQMRRKWPLGSSETGHERNILEVLLGEQIQH